MYVVETMDKGGFRRFLHSFLLISFHSPSMKKRVIIYFDLKCYQLSVFFSCSQYIQSSESIHSAATSHI